MITYADSKPAHVTFTLLRLAPKALCPKPARRRAHNNAPAHCPRYLQLGKFTHLDHAGRNRAAAAVPIPADTGQVLLDATPTFAGTIGETITIAFTVTR